MTPHDFDDVISQSFSRICSILKDKGDEYAPGTDPDRDRLAAFKSASALTRTPPTEALAGMMLKHTISLYDMLYAGAPDQFSAEDWDEKIFDHLNYLILLRALLFESRGAIVASSEDPKG